MLAPGVSDRELERAFETIDAARVLTLARRQGQRPRLYYRRELEERPLVVAETGN